MIAFGAVTMVGVSAVIGVVAWEWTYVDRLRHFPKDLITNVAWYTPRERIPGGNGASLPRAKPDETGMRADGLEVAAKLAEAKNASALLVVHGGRLVLERHWRGHQPGEPTNSASMAKTVTSLLVGIALEEGTLPSLDEPAAKWIPAWRDDARARSRYVTCFRCIPACGRWGHTMSPSPMLHTSCSVPICDTLSTTFRPWPSQEPNLTTIM